MKSKEEFRRRFDNGEFNEDLKNIHSAEEMVEFARNLGYDLTMEDVLGAKLNKEEMAMIAGGKNDTTVNNYYYTDNSTTINGDNNKQANIK